MRKLLAALALGFALAPAALAAGETPGLTIVVDQENQTVHAFLKGSNEGQCVFYNGEKERFASPLFYDDYGTASYRMDIASGETVTGRVVGDDLTDTWPKCVTVSAAASGSAATLTAGGFSNEGGAPVEYSWEAVWPDGVAAPSAGSSGTAVLTNSGGQDATVKVVGVATFKTPDGQEIVSLRSDPVTVTVPAAKANSSSGADSSSGNVSSGSSGGSSASSGSSGSSSASSGSSDSSGASSGSSGSSGGTAANGGPSSAQKPDPSGASGGNGGTAAEPVPDAAPEPAALLFQDVPEGSYFAEPVRWAVSNNITQGTGANAFSPDASCTRAQMVTFLWRQAGGPEPDAAGTAFTDVGEGQYYDKAILWAVGKGITNGTSATTFSPDAIVTRAQSVTFLWRSVGSPEGGASSFTDVPEGPYSAAVAWAASNGVTQGTSAVSFSPDSPCTRAQIVTFLYRARA